MYEAMRDHRTREEDSEMTNGDLHATNKISNVQNSSIPYQHSKSAQLLAFNSAPSMAVAHSSESSRQRRKRTRFTIAQMAQKWLEADERKFNRFCISPIETNLARNKSEDNWLGTENNTQTGKLRKNTKTRTTSFACCADWIDNSCDLERSDIAIW
jgi:hypothetical protein